MNTPFTQKTDYYEETSTGEKSQQLRQFGDNNMLKILSLHFQLEKKLNLQTMILSYFPLGGCFDEVVDNRTNYQGYKCFYQGYKCVHSFSITH